MTEEELRRWAEKMDRTGKTHSEESKQKMREAKLGKKRGPYTKKNKDGETK